MARAPRIPLLPAFWELRLLMQWWVFGTRHPETDGAALQPPPQVPALPKLHSNVRTPSPRLVPRHAAAHPRLATPLLPAPSAPAHTRRPRVTPRLSVRRRLAEALQHLRTEGSPVEVVLVSSDHNEDEFERSRRALGPNTFALPFAEQARKTMLSNMFDTLGVPTLVLLDKDHKVRRAPLLPALF